MSKIHLIKTEPTIPFKNQSHPYIYPINQLMFFIINEDLEYVIYCQDLDKIFYQGIFPEESPEKMQLILDDDYGWFFTFPEQGNFRDIFYYSPTYKEFRWVNLQSEKVVSKYPYQSGPTQFIPFIKINYFAADKTVIFIHMSSSDSQIRVEEFNLQTKKSELLREVYLDEMVPNCMVQYQDMFLFTNQSFGESEHTFKIYVSTKKDCFEIKVNYEKGINPLEFGILKLTSAKLFICYNNNNSKESGICFYSLAGYEFDQDIELHHGGDNFQNVILPRNEDSLFRDSLDGGIVVDVNMMTVTLSSLKGLTLYSLLDNAGHISLDKKDSREILPGEVPNCFPLSKTYLVSKKFEESTNKLELSVFNSASIKCLYFWLMKKCNILEEFKEGAAIGILERLVD